jgi:DNA-binding PadR family transcriptional regulator
MVDSGRHRSHRDRGDIRHDIGREMREELRRSLRRGASGADLNSLRDFFSHGRPGPVVRRGEVRNLILAALREKPMHGYEVIQELEAQSDGRWRPSAGSVYPTLQQLADEGLVTGEEVDGRRTYTLTDMGRNEAERADRRADRPRWTGRDDDDRDPDIKALALQLAGAVLQVNKIGSPNAKREVVRILTEARREIYRLLSEDEPIDVPDEEGAR